MSIKKGVCAIVTKRSQSVLYIDIDSFLEFFFRMLKSRLFSNERKRSVLVELLIIVC